MGEDKQDAANDLKSDAHHLEDAAGRSIEADYEALHTLLDAQGFGVVLVERSGTIKRSNGLLEELLQKDDLADAAARFEGLFSPNHLSDISQLINPRDGEHPANIEAPLNVVPPRWLRLRYHSQSGDERLLLLEDISDRKQMEVSLKQAHKLEAIGNLANGIAHDFNNILMVMQGHIDVIMAMSDERLVREARSHLAVAAQSGERARRLISQLLTYSQRGRLEPKLTDCAELVESLADELRSVLPVSTKLEVKTSAHPHAKLDSLQTEQVLMNLCLNARDVLDGHGEINITVREAEIDNALCASCHETFSGHYVQITVADNGPGIDPQILEHMFDPFVTTKARGQGTGMGLAVVHGRIHDQRGHIRVASDPNHGTTFSVFFPISFPTDQQSSADTHTSLVERSSPATVALIDDEVPILEYLTALLTMENLEPITYASADQFLNELVDPDFVMPDVILTDQVMPGRSGLELAEALAERAISMPVVLYTGNPETIRQPLPANVVDVVTKPIKAQTLLDVLGDVIFGERTIVPPLAH